MKAMRQRVLEAVGICTFAGATAVTALALTGASTPAVTMDDLEVRLGTYNPQEAFNMYHGAQAFNQRSQELQRAMQEAQQQGDQQRLMEIQNELQMKQERVIQQFFADMEQAMPDVADEHGIHIIAVEIAYVAPELGEPRDITRQLIEEVNEAAGDSEPQRDEPDSLPW